MDSALDALKYLALIPILLIIIALLGWLLLELSVIVGVVRGKKRRRELIAQFRREHSADGKIVLIAYSASPIWAPYIETNILPRIGHLAVVLKWPKRKRKAYADRLEYQLSRGYNPVAIVIPPEGVSSTVELHDAFMKYKRGHTDELRLREEELYRLVRTYSSERQNEVQSGD